MSLNWESLEETLKSFGGSAESFQSLSAAAAVTFLAIFLGVALFVVPYLLRSKFSSTLPPTATTTWRQYFGGVLPRLRAEDSIIQRAWIPSLGQIYLVNTTKSEAAVPWALENSAASLVNGYQASTSAVSGTYLTNRAIHQQLSDARVLAWTKKALAEIFPVKDAEVQKSSAKAVKTRLAQLLKKWDDHGSLENALAAFERLVSEVNTSLLLGESNSDIAGLLAKALLPSTLSNDRSRPSPQFVSAIASLTDALLKEPAVASEKRPAYLLNLVEQYSDDKTRKVNNFQVAKVVYSILLMATQNTAAVLTSTLFLLASNPEISQKVQQEVDSQSLVLAKVGQIGFAELADALPLLRSCIRETLRITNHSVVLRKTTERVKLGKFSVPPNSLVAIDYRPLLTNGEIFPAPRIFKPSRFEATDGARKVAADAKEDDKPLLTIPPKQERVSQVASLVYGAGQHPCPGAELSTGTILLVLATVLSKYRVAISLPILDPLSGKRVHLPPNGLTRQPNMPLSTPVAPLELSYSLRV